MRQLALLLMLLPGTGLSTTAASDVAIDSSRSRVRFELPLLMLGKVEGSFEQIRGSVRDGPDGVRICAAVTVASAHMAQRKNTEELLGASFFDSARFPELLFRSQPVPRADLQAGRTLAGYLTVKGIRKPAVFRIVERQCPSPQTSQGCRLVLDGSLRRGEFGMDARRGVLGDAVALRLQVQMCDSTRPCTPTAPSCD